MKLKNLFYLFVALLSMTSCSNEIVTLTPDTKVDDSETMQESWWVGKVFGYFLDGGFRVRYCREEVSSEYYDLEYELLNKGQTAWLDEIKDGKTTLYLKGDSFDLNTIQGSTSSVNSINPDTRSESETIHYMTTPILGEPYVEIPLEVVSEKSNKGDDEITLKGTYEVPMAQCI